MDLHITVINKKKWHLHNFYLYISKYRMASIWFRFVQLHFVCQSDFHLVSELWSSFSRTSQIWTALHASGNQRKLKQLKSKENLEIQYSPHYHYEVDIILTILINDYYYCFYETVHTWKAKKEDVQASWFWSWHEPSHMFNDFKRRKLYKQTQITTVLGGSENKNKNAAEVY